MSSIYRDTDLAWLAGIVDGEGSVLLCKINSGKYRSPVLSVSNNSLEILNRIKTLFGGTIVRKKNLNPSHGQNYDWRLKYSKATALMDLILKYMSHPTKIFRIQHILDEYSKVTPRNGKYTKAQLKAKTLFDETFFLGPSKSH